MFVSIARHENYAFKHTSYFILFFYIIIVSSVNLHCNRRFFVTMLAVEYYNFVIHKIDAKFVCVRTNIVARKDWIGTDHFSSSPRKKNYAYGMYIIIIIALQRKSIYKFVSLWKCSVSSNAIHILQQ